MQISAIQGIVFNEFYVGENNKNGVYILNIDKAVTPRLRYSNLSVPLMNGSYKKDNKYDDIDIKVSLAITGNNYEDKMNKAREIIDNWMGKESRLVLSDNPTVFYDAKIYDSIDIDEKDFYLQMKLTFTASYCKYALYNDDVESRLFSYTNARYEDNPSVSFSNITSQLTKTIRNEGNTNSDALIYVSGQGNLVNLRIKDRQFSIKNVVNSVVIDTKRMVVYEVVNNKKQSKLFDFTGLFPVIESGINEVVINGVNFNVNIKIVYRDTYLW